MKLENKIKNVNIKKISPVVLTMPDKITGILAKMLVKREKLVET